ncbi:MAG: hypothetical protein KF754_11690 [Planctomycetes bacterium]|nr:hypothetical protein [Planctomycetota bacterium]
MYYGWVGAYMRAAERESSRNATAAESAANRAESALMRMEDTIQRQALIIRSLLEVCARKQLFDEKEFRDIVNEIDLSDGRLDGKYKPAAGPRNCPECGKINGKSAITCMYCSAHLPDRELI